MKYVKMILDTPYRGTVAVAYGEYPDDIPTEEIGQDMGELALENADEYSYLVFGWGIDAQQFAERNNIPIEEAEAMIENYYEASVEKSYWMYISEEEWLRSAMEDC